jgi:hypothetical protein
MRLIHASGIFTGIVLATLLLGSNADAAEIEKPRAKNAVHLELGGPGILYSVNYERFVLPKLSIRAGIGMFGLRENTTGDSIGVLAVPVTAQYFLGKGAHHLELGLGIFTGGMWSDLNSYEKTETFGLIGGTATVGYRYQRPGGGFLFRIAFTPLLGGNRFAPLGMPLQPWGSIGAGYAF